VWFSKYLFSPFFCTYVCLFIVVGIFNPRVDDMLYLFGNFLTVLQVGVGCIILPSHTHLLLHIMSGALYPGLRKLRVRRGCVAMSQGCTSFSGFCENPS